MLPSACRFQPTCSEYMMQAMEKYGVARGVGMGVRRHRGAIRFMREGSTRSASDALGAPYGEKRTFDGGAAPDRIRADGAGAVRHAVFYKPAPQPRANQGDCEDRCESRPDESAAPASGQPSAKPPAEMPGQIQAGKEETRHHRYGSLSRRVFESRRGGAELDAQEFQGSRRQAAGPGESAALGKVPGAVLARVQERQKPSTDPNTALFKIDRAGR